MPFARPIAVLAAAAVGLLLAYVSPARAADAPAAKPNLVLFLADDLSWADCSIADPKSGIATPNMDRVATDGMTFTQAYVASPSCAPSRAALLTGLYGPRNGSMFNHTPPDPAHQRWAAYLKAAGYETAAIGKVAHYAQVKDFGFDVATHFTYHDDDCVDAAITWLSERQADAAKRAKPLCLIVGTNWPHVPWPQKSRYKPDALPLPGNLVDTAETRQWRARYAEAVCNADRDLGLIYDAVRAQLPGDTLFVFTADHGAQLPFAKWNCYDAGLRTPLVAVWPGKVKAGTRTDAMVNWVDLLPTYLAAAGSTVPPAGTADGQIDGRSFLDVLLGKADAHADATYAAHSGDGKMNEYPMRTVRTARWRYVRNLTPDAEFHTHIDKAKAEDGKGYWDSWVKKAKTDPAAAAAVARYVRRPAEELYDAQADPNELKNLAADPAHAATLAEMRTKLDAWMKGQGDAGLATENAHRPKAPAAEGKS